jgi:diacylglycerol kinase (ATP)
MPRRTLAIINPCSSNGSTGRRLSELRESMRHHLGEVEIVLTEAPGHGSELARKAAEEGIDRVIAAGGDGTASEVASGLLASGRASNIELGLIPLGTGCDLARGLELPLRAANAIEAMARGATRRVDAGRVHYVAHDGSNAVSHFLNVASFGLSGLTDLYVRTSPKMFGGTVAFAIAAIRSIVSYRCPDVSIAVDGLEVHRGPLNLAAVANGRFFGGGMKIAPNAQFLNGRFDAIVVGEMGKLGLISKFPKLFSGQHLDLACVSSCGAQVVEAEALSGEAVLLDIDGEPLGRLPARFEVLPGAIRLLGIDPPWGSGD